MQQYLKNTAIELKASVFVCHSRRFRWFPLQQIQHPQAEKKNIRSDHKLTYLRTHYISTSKRLPLSPRRAFECPAVQFPKSAAPYRLISTDAPPYVFLIAPSRNACPPRAPFTQERHELYLVRVCLRACPCYDKCW